MIFIVVEKIKKVIAHGRTINDVDDKPLSSLDMVTMFLSFLSVVLFVVEYFVPITREHFKILTIVDDLICAVFIIDFIVDFRSAEDKKAFMKYGWIDLLACIPTIDFIMSDRLTRIFRMLRLLKTISSARTIMVHQFKNKANGMITMAFLVCFAVIIFSSMTVLYFENNPASNIKTAEDAVWWTFTTITTVGYGDRFPVTTEGRVIGVFTMIVGISVFSIVTAFIASKFINQNNQKDEKIED